MNFIYEESCQQKLKLLEKFGFYVIVSPCRLAFIRYPSKLVWNAHCQYPCAIQDGCAWSRMAIPFVKPFWSLFIDWLIV